MAPDGREIAAAPGKTFWKFQKCGVEFQTSLNCYLI